jgi:hypothetical protein
LFCHEETLTADPPSREATARQVTRIKTDQKRYCFGLRQAHISESEAQTDRPHLIPLRNKGEEKTSPPQLSVNCYLLAAGRS